jgi:hypothetical protein
VATVHNTVKETIRAHLTLVHVFHAYASTDTPWVAHALSHFTPVRYGRIAFVSAAHEATVMIDGPRGGRIELSFCFQNFNAEFKQS